VRTGARHAADGSASYDEKARFIASCDIAFTLSAVHVLDATEKDHRPGEQFRRRP
jgi:hypothetical protein